MPEEKGEDESDAEAHEPSDEEKRGSFHVLKLAQHRDPLGHLARCLRENLQPNRLDELMQ